VVGWGAWLDQNWFTLVQTLGIIGSVCLTAAALRRDARARKVGDYLALAAHHRELWSEVPRNAELVRVLQPEIDLVASPLSPAETEFLNLVIVHFQSGWLLAQGGGLITLNVLANDANSFFALPLPRVVWEETRHMRDPKFVSFIEQAVKGKGYN
jgi:hypothetical protein